MRRRISTWVCLGLVAGLVAAPAGGKEASQDVVEEVLAILHERGIVDDGQYSQLVDRHRGYEKEHRSLFEKIEWSGDLRARVENFWFDRDETGVDRDNRTRFRYRLRLQGLVPINDSLDAVFRLASGENDPRSTNRSAGVDPDFGPDDVFIDRAYLQFRAPSGWLGEGSALKLSAGKVPNPFLWKNGKDYMLWDGDINPEGGALQLQLEPAEMLKLFVNSGYFILDENSTGEDPHVFGLQGGFGVAATPQSEFGGRMSWYSWRSLDDDFFTRAIGEGNLDGGLTHDGFAPPPAGASRSNDGVSATELAAYFLYRGIEDWPLLVYGHFAHNFDADRVPGGGKEDEGWGVGLEVGDKTKFVKLGAGYYELEANFWPAQFTDSDLFDGVTNRGGWTVYGSRQILPRTDLNITLFLSDELEDDVPPFGSSVSNAERYRLQTDLVMKF